MLQQQGRSIMVWRVIAPGGFSCHKRAVSTMDLVRYGHILQSVMLPAAVLSLEIFLLSSKATPVFIRQNTECTGFRNTMPRFYIGSLRHPTYHA